MKISDHAKEMLKERGILEAWLRKAIEEPDKKAVLADMNTHYYKRIQEHGNRVLHVVVNQQEAEPSVITVFFDRRVREL